MAMSSSRQALDQPTAARGWSIPAINWPQIGLVALIAVLGYYVLYPLFLILLNSFNTAPLGQAPVYGIQAWVQAWQSAGIGQALGNTLLLAAAYQIVSFPVAIGIALLLARTNVPGAHAFEFCFWLSFFIPELSTTLGWMLLLDPHTGLLNGLASGVFHLPTALFNVYSFWGIVWVHLMAHAVSFKVMLLTPAFRNMDSTLEEAGHTSGASAWTTFRRVTVPLMTPVLVIVFVLGLLRLFESFEIELLLGTPIGYYVYSTKIVQLVQGDPPKLAQAAALGSITLLLLLVAGPLQRRMTMRRSFTTVSGRMRPAKLNLAVWRWPAFAALALLVVLLVVVPIASVVGASFMTRFGFFNLPQPWTLSHWQDALGDSDFLLAVKNTLVVASTVAAIGIAVFSVVAYVIVRGVRLRGRGVLDLLVWVPSVIPGALAGLGLLWMFLTTPLFQPFYGTTVLLVGACLMGGMTLATQTVKATVLQLKPDLEEAARTSGATWLRTYVRIIVPLLGPTLVVVGTLLFLFSANATASIIMLASAKTRTLSLLTLEYVMEGQLGPAAVTTVIITALTATLALVARSVGRQAITGG